jgi:hypothetical protein
MGFYPPGTIEAVDNIMGDFMGYRVAETVLIIFGKQPGVVSNTPLLAFNLVHASAFASEVKVYAHRCKVATIVACSHSDTAVSGLDNLSLLLFGNGLYIFNVFH